MRTVILPAFLSLTVAACSSDDSTTVIGSSPDSSSVTAATTNAPVTATPVTDTTTGSPTEANFRIATMSVDFDTPGFEIPSLINEFDYDSAGRLATKRSSRVGSTDDATITTYTYNNSGIQSRANGFVTETFSLSNGLISQIMSTDVEPLSYTYDNAGKLIGVIGDAFSDRDSVCGSSTVIFGNEDTTNGSGDSLPVQGPPVFEIAYTGDRVDSITKSTGEVISFEYNEQDLLARQTKTGGCDDYVNEYTYRRDGLPLAFTGFSTDFGQETEEQTVIYTEGRITQTHTTISDETNALVEENTTTFLYDASGRLTGLSSVEESISDGASDTATINVTLTYEEESCVAQSSAYPDAALMASVIVLPPQADLNLNCVFSNEF